MQWLFLFFFFASLSAGDRWDFYMRTHSDITFNERNEEFLVQVADRVANKFHLIMHQSAPRIQPFKDTRWNYSFFSMEKLEPLEASALVKKVFLDLQAEIHRSFDAILYLTEDVDASTFSPSLIGLKIAFFQRDGKRMEPPYTARVYMDGGKPFYNMSQEGQLVQPLALN